jgi:hypothetical protein
MTRPAEGPSLRESLYGCEGSLHLLALSPVQAIGICAPPGGRKSLHKQSFWQQILPLTKAIPQTNPVLQRRSRALLESRFCPSLQSLSCEQLAEQ